MFYGASKLIWFLMRPSNLLLFLSLISLALGLFRFRRLALGLGGIIVLAACLITFTPLSSWLGLSLEQRFPVLDGAQLDQFDGFIVLGGSVDIAVTEKVGLVQQSDASERMIEMARLMRRYPDKTFLYSGGGWVYWEKTGRPMSEADMARLYLLQDGLDVNKVLFENQSYNTWQNAVLSYELAQPQPGQRWALITSAWHMPRAMGAFRHAGWTNLTAYPVDFRETKRQSHASYALGQALFALDLYMKEYVGLLAYWLTGRSSEFFPG
jgi:uncharacterized SAM-binding protein YcdF (DUF218 family)